MLELLSLNPMGNFICQVWNLRKLFTKSDVVLNENHLKTILDDYFSYYNKYRTHLGLNKDSPEGRPIQTEGKIGKIPLVNGLHHVYYRKAA
jgi:hypothetical protein